MRGNRILEADGLCIPAWTFRWATCFVLVCLLIQTASSVTLTHRYSFVTDAGDSVGSADGVLQGNAYVTNGALVLDGTNSSVQLPNDLFTNYNSISFELWFSVGALTSPQARLYSFSGSGGSMTYQLQGQGTYFVGAPEVVTLASPPVAGVVHLVWTQDSASTNARLYVNGVMAGQNASFAFSPSQVGSTTNNYIGGIGSASTVSNFQGDIMEFRIYQGAMSPLDVAVADALGPDQAPQDPGALEDVRIIAPPSLGPGAAIRPGVYADFANVTNVNISTQPDLVLSSDNTNVIAITPDQRLQTVGLGTADITANYQGLSNTLAVPVVVPQDVVLIHRYSFNEQTNDWIVHDSANSADGQLVGGDSLISFTGNGELTMAGGATPLYPNPSLSYVNLPPHLISCLSEVSIEAWVTWTVGSGGTASRYWQRIFDFGSQLYVGGSYQFLGSTYLFLTPAGSHTSPGWQLHTTISTNNGLNGEIQGLTWTNFLPFNVTSFVAVTYSPVRGVMKMYLNGVPIASGGAPLALSGIVDTNNWLGRSQFSQDPFFAGHYDEFRIYGGLLSDEDVAADYTAGPDVVGVDFVLHDFPSTNSLSITWGTTATNWFLESSPVLGASAVWTPVSVTPMLQNGRWQVNVPISEDASYFRLHAPP